MSWNDKAKEWGVGNITFLETDKEEVTFVIVDDPVMFTGKFKQQEQQRVGFPIVTEEGFTLLINTVRTFNKLRKHESLFKTNSFTVTRQGVENDPNTKYPVTVGLDSDLTNRLFKLAETEYNSELLEEAIESAKKILER